MKKIIIIGAGISGMSAAMHLIKSGFTVEIFESSNKIGGRCFSFFDKINWHIAQSDRHTALDAVSPEATTVSQGIAEQARNDGSLVNKKLFEIDNGQHLFSGAYKEFFELMKWLGNENFFSEKKNLKVDFVELNKKNNFEYSLDCTKYKGLTGVAHGFLKMKGIDWFDKWIILQPPPPIYYFPRKDISTLDFFQMFLNQTINRLWKPMVIAIMNAPIEKASTKLFLKTLRKMLFRKNGFSLLHSKVPLSNLFENFFDKINNSGSKIFFNTVVKEIIVENGICKGIVKNNSEKIYSDFVISTVSPKQLSKFHFSFSHLRNIFIGSPIISVYLWLNQPIIQGKYISCINTKIEWIFNKNNLLEISDFGDNDKNTYQIALTVSAANELILLDDTDLMKIIETEIKQISNCAEIKILAYRIIRDKNATPLITFENNSLRPKTKTDISNFYLAGDWIQTDLPATIESAALSGKLAAMEIVKNGVKLA